MATRNSDALWTPANVVTLVRICGVPLFVLALLCPWPEWFPTAHGLEVAKPWIATALFVVLAATDSLDGYLARSRGEVTTFGKFMDPLADKLLVCSALIALVELDVLPAWVVLIIISRDFIISGIRLVAASKGEVIAASWYGKFKTVFQMVALVLFMLMGSMKGVFGEEFGEFFFGLSWFVMAIALALTIISLVDYFYNARFLLGFAKREEGIEMPAEPSNEVTALHSRCLDLSKAVIEKGVAAGVTVSSVESLTGGLITGFLTGVSGSSAVVRGGLVTYATETKATVAGVDFALLDAVGPVDEGVAIQMAQGGRHVDASDICIAVTGLAGPGGAEPGKPVGTVCFGIAAPNGREYTERLVFAGDRLQVRLQTVEHALKLMIAEMEVLEQ